MNRIRQRGSDRVEADGERNDQEDQHKAYHIGDSVDRRMKCKILKPSADQVP